MRKHLLAAAVTAALTVTSLSVAEPATAATSDIVTTPAQTRATDAQRLLDLINAHRKSKGLNPVKYSATIAKIAQGQSDRLVRQEVIDHTNDFLDRNRAGAYDAAGEIHAVSWKVSVDELMAWWKSSGAHNKILTDPKMEVIGIGLTYVDGSLTGTKQGWRLAGTVASYGYPAGAAPADTRTTVPTSRDQGSIVAVGPFTDVPATHVFATQIEWVKDTGVLRGWPNGTFAPNQTMTRDQVAAALYRIAGSPAYTPPAKSPFADVPTNHAFYKEMAWLRAKGISTGWVSSTGVRTFKPGLAVTRDQTAAFLYRLAGKPAYTPPAASPFRDVSTRRAFYKEMAWMSDQGISQGWNDGTYRPDMSISRAVMATFLYRYAHRA